MAGVSIRWNAAEEQRLLRSVSGPTGKYLARIAALIETAAKGFTPVDTGRLRSSITWVVLVDAKGLVAVISTNVVYAIWVHNGTRYVTGRPFLVNGMRAVMGVAA